MVDRLCSRKVCFAWSKLELFTYSTLSQISRWYKPARRREKVEVRTLQKVLIDLKIVRRSSRTKSSCPVDGFGLKVVPSRVTQLVEVGAQLRRTV